MESTPQEDGGMKLNLGCGKDIKEGCINADLAGLDGVDVVVDLDKYPWPWGDNTFDVIYCNRIIGYLGNYIKAMEEIWRIAKPDAKVYIKESYWSYKGAHAPLTRTFFHEYSIRTHFTDEGEFNYRTRARFMIVDVIYNYNRPWGRLPLKCLARNIFINVVRDIEIFMFVKKENDKHDQEA